MQDYITKDEMGLVLVAMRMDKWEDETRIKDWKVYIDNDDIIDDIIGKFFVSIWIENDNMLHGSKKIDGKMTNQAIGVLWYLWDEWSDMIVNKPNKGRTLS